MVDGLIALHLDNYKASGAELIMGTGRFTAPKTIEVALNTGGRRSLTGDRVVLPPFCDQGPCRRRTAS
jgi:hypothetical protein